MLGQGLESLIPPKRANPSDLASSAGPVSSPPPGGFDSTAQSASPAPVPVPTDPATDPATDPSTAVPEEVATSDITSPATDESEHLLPQGWGEPAPTMTPWLQPEPTPAEPETFPATPVAFPRPQPIARPAPTVPRRTPGGTPDEIGAVFHIEVDQIVPNPQQPRRNFDETGLRELANSIREFGILQPLVVSKVVREVPTGTEVEYQLIAGERRWLAAKILGLERVPAIIRNVELDREKLELAVIENLQREDLNPIEMARAFARLQDEFRLTQREIATRLGKSREVVANTLRLLDLPSNVQNAIERGEITESHGRLLLTVDDPAIRERLFQDLIANKLSTRELRVRAEVSQKASAAERVPADPPPEIRQAEEKLALELGTPVKIYAAGGGGKITISFYSQEELESLLRRIAGTETD